MASSAAAEALGIHQLQIDDADTGRDDGGLPQGLHEMISPYGTPDKQGGVQDAPLAPAPAGASASIPRVVIGLGLGVLLVASLSLASGADPESPTI